MGLIRLGRTGAWRFADPVARLLVPTALSCGLFGCARQPATEHASAVALTIGLPIPASQTGETAGVRELVSVISNEGLVRTLRDGRHEAQLAERWDTLDGGLAIRFHLRPGAKFHDGTPLTAELVKESLERSGADRAQLFNYPMLRSIEKVAVSDNRSLVVRVTQPSALLLDDLEVPIRKRAADGTWVGTGPFQLQSEAPDGTVMRANREYHRGRPPIDLIQLRTYPTVRTAWAAMMRGEIDFLYEVPVDTREFVEGESSVRVFPFLRDYVYLLVFNSRRPLFQDRAMRIALNLAVDRKHILDRTLRGYGRVASGVWPLHWAFQGNDAPFAYAPQEADRLLAASGYAMPPAVQAARRDRMPSRLRFTCLVATSVSPYEQLAVLVQRQLYDVGVDMQIEPVSIEAFIDRVQRGEYDAVLLDLNGGPGLVRPYIFWRSSAETMLWNFGYKAADPALDGLRNARTDDEIRRAAAEFQRVFRDDPPAIFLAWGETARAVSRRFDVAGEPDQDVIRTIWQWRPAQAMDR